MAIVKIIISDSDDGVHVSTELNEPLESDENATPAHFVATQILNWLDETNETYKQKETE